MNLYLVKDPPVYVVSESMPAAIGAWRTSGGFTPEHEPLSITLVDTNIIVGMMRCLRCEPPLPDVHRIGWAVKVGEHDEFLISPSDVRLVGPIGNAFNFASRADAVPFANFARSYAHVDRNVTVVELFEDGRGNRST